MLQSFEQKAFRFEKHEIQTLKNKKRPYSPFAVSNDPDANGIDQSAADSRGERQARAGLAPATSKSSHLKGGGWGWWAGCDSNKPSGTFEPKATKAKKRRANGEAASGERGAQRPSGYLRANIVPVIRTQVPFRQGRRREARAERAQRFY